MRLQKILAFIRMGWMASVRVIRGDHPVNDDAGRGHVQPNGPCDFCDFAVFFYLHAQSSDIREEDQRNDSSGQENMRNQDDEVHRSNPSFPSEFGGFGGQVKGNVTDQKQNAQGQGRRRKRPVYLDVLVFDGDECADEAKKGRTIEVRIQLGKEIKGRFDFVGEVFDGWDQKQQSDRGGDDYRHRPNESFDVAFVFHWVVKGWFPVGSKAGMHLP